MKSAVRVVSTLGVFLFFLMSKFAYAQSPTCAQFGTITLSSGTYTVQNNEWNSSATQCISATDPSSFSITQSAISNPTNGAPGSYPSIYRGCHWGNCTTNSGLPLQVSNIGSALSSWNTTQPGSGAYDVAYDIWFNQAPSTNGQPDGAELMIWLNSLGGVQPAGSPVGQVTINGSAFTVWTARMSTWNYIAYVSNTPATTVTNLDIHAFINDAMSRNSINSAWYLIDVEAGFELWQAGAGLATNSFSFSSSAGNPGTGSSNILISLQAISPNPSHIGTATNSTVNFTNEESTFASVTLVSELTDQAGNVSASQSQAANLAPQQTLAVTLTSFPTSVGSYNVVGVVKDGAGNVLQQSTVGTLTVN
ncbi:MAG TPA: hypothetical protein VHV32_08980 [Candidatus Angelobacter sp.]|jgi:hypothetical protein|nr:hypothetical protein [Candidatus Angelobacter sp.]